MKCWLVVLLFASNLFAAGDFEPLYRHDDITVPRKSYSLFVVDRVNVRKAIEEAQYPDQKRNQLWHHRAETNILLSGVYNLISFVYWDRDLIDDQESSAFEGLMDYKLGKYPSISIAEYGNPYNVYETVSVAGDRQIGPDKYELPAESRCISMGMKPLTRTEPRAHPIRIRYIRREGKLEFNEEISEFLSEIPHWEGGNIELKGVAKAPHAPTDFGPAIHRVLIREHFSLYTNIPVPYRLPPLTGELKHRADALKEKYPDIPNKLLYPDQQEWVIAEKLVAQTVQRATPFLYEVHAAFDKPSQEFYDSDFDKTSYVSEIRRTTFEQETADRLAKRPSFEIVSKGDVSFSEVEVMDCFIVLGRKGLTLSKLPKDFVPGRRLMDVRGYVVPRDSILNKRRR